MRNNSIREALRGLLGGLAIVAGSIVEDGGLGVISKDKLRLALRVISGRLECQEIEDEQYRALGFDTYKFGYYGKPTKAEILECCERIVVDAIAPAQQDV